MHKPVFIIGSPRSGTTITLNILASHQEFAWISNLVEKQPENVYLSFINNVYRIPIIGKNLYLKRVLHKQLPAPFNRLPTPVEPWNFWNTYLSNFQWGRDENTPPRRRTAADISISEAKIIRSLLHTNCKIQYRKRFLSKYTDFPRMTYLLKAFPDAIFLHIVRDGRAVAYSYYRKITSGQFNSWQERDWWSSGWEKSWREEWQNKYADPLSFAAYQWKFFVQSIWEDAKLVPANQYLQIKYEDLIKSPRSVMDQILAQCELKNCAEVYWVLDRTPLKMMNNKWREALDDKQKKCLEDIIHEDIFINTFDE